MVFQWIKGKKIDRIKYPNFGHFQKHSSLSKSKMSLTKKKLYAQGKIVPWNKGLTFNKEKYVSQYKNVKGKGIPFGRYVWMQNNLPYVPKGFEVHHIDFNQKNNNPKNLVLFDRKSHRQYHAQISKLIKKIKTGGGNY